MITQLEIKNFRGFSEYKIDDVGQVNLLVGTNNCGKTSVLEAVHLLKSRGDAPVLLSILGRRGERIETEVLKDAMPEPDLCRFFHGFKMKSNSGFSVACADDSKELLSVLVQELSPQSEFFDNLPDFSGHYQLNVIWKNEKENKEQNYPISQTGGLFYNYIRKMYLKPISANDSTVELIPSSAMSTQKTITLFDRIVLTPDEDMVLEALRIIEPDITRIASFGGERSSSRTRGGFLVKSSKWEERIPIGSFGDGIWRLLGLALSLVAAKNGTLLIDEIDTGLHYTVMSKMWKLVCVTAKKLNVQVFATTHSRDCWETLADNAIEDEFADMSIRIHRINKDKKQATTFTNREMHLALNRELEVR
uniref:AAA family ATPase n=1 Tax=Candidatus Electronema sp. TaxID=2698783 RepID=UPI0040567B04